MPPPDIPVPTTGADAPVLPAAVVVSAASGHLETTLHDVVRAGVDQVGALFGALGVLTGDGHRLDRLVVVGPDPQEAERISTLSTGQEVHQFVTEPTVLEWDQLHIDPVRLGFPEGHPARAPFLAVPVRVGGALFGNLYLTQKRSGGPFTTADVEVVQALAGVAGLAIGNARLAESAERGRSWFQAGTEIATSLLSGARSEDVLRAIADRIAELASADVTGVLIPVDDNCLVVAAASGGDAADLEGVRIPLTATHVGNVHRSRRPSVIDDVSTDPVLGRHADVAVEITRGLGPGLMVPFGQPPSLGLVVAMRRKGREPFQVGPLDPLIAFVTRTALALELARSQEREHRLQRQADRDRIARDLHDHVVQRIFATVLSLDRLSRSLEASQPGIASRLGRSIDELEATIAEIRTAIFELHEDDELAGSSVRGRLSDVVRGVTEGFPLRRDLRLRGPLDELPRSLAPDLVAVVRELLTNVVRHAGATRVTVSVDVDDEVRVTVTDDGTGLPEVHARSGLANLADRAERRGGRLILSSGPAGTEVHWTVPRPVR